MPARTKHNAARTLLCATRFWSVDHVISGKWRETGKGTTPSFRSHVRGVVLKQGFTPGEVDKAERKLISEGLLLRHGEGRDRPTLSLTPKAAKVSCATVKLAPWTDDYPGSSLEGVKKRRPAKRRR